MNSFEIKTLCAVSLWVVSVVFGVLLPYFLWNLSPKRRRRGTNYNIEDDSSEQDDSSSRGLITNHHRREHRSRFLACTTHLAAWLRGKLADGKFSSIAYCLCGGVFLGVSLLDLIPQSRAVVGTVLNQSNIDTTYPVAEFMIAFGLLLVMSVENIVSETVLPSKSHNTATRPRTPRISENSSDGDDSGNAAEIIALQVQQNVSQYRMYILVVTLSLHSIFEGLAIGFQEELTTLVQLVIAVSVHKAVLSFGIGLPLFETLGQCRRVSVAVICMMIFCTTSPLGCLIGAFISGDQLSNSAAALIASAVLQCLATGTFLYVTFVEVIPREFSHHARKENVRSNSSVSIEGLDDCELGHQQRVAMDHKSQLSKLLALIIGFAVASGLQFL